MTYIADGSCATLAVVLAIAAAGKLRTRAERGSFAASLRALRVPVPAALAVSVPAAEAAVAAALLAPATRRSALGAAAVLLLAFGVVALRAERRGLAVRCRCFGADGEPLGRVQAWRNATLGAIAVAGWGAAAHGGAGGTAATAVALAAGGLLGVALVHWDDLRFLLAPATEEGGPWQPRRS
jgi:Methylamine utilisation protein MauE